MSTYDSSDRLDASIERAAAQLNTAESGNGGGARGLNTADLSALRTMMDQLRCLMFPGYFEAGGAVDAGNVGSAVRSIAELLRAEVSAVLAYGPRPGRGVGTGAAFVGHVVDEFVRALPRVRAMLRLDVEAAYDGDPAAEHVDEIILCYPGLEAIFTHRIAHELYQLGVPILPRVISEQAHSSTGIDIHPGASIGDRFFIDHGSATVLGETSVIGRQVKIYQGVTLGARSFPKDERGRAIRGLKRHPTIGDRVTIYAGAVILGGDTLIGDDCVIAGGVFVTSSVPAGHVVQQTRPELVLRPNAPAGSVKRPESALASEQARFVARPASEASWLDAGAGI